MRYIKLLIEYDGTNYQGWQTQRSGRTIQDILKKTILSITDENVKLTGASRTDAGVHAIEQVAVFSTQSKLQADTISRAMNAKLPPDIRILSAEDTEKYFHPRYDAVKKKYFYIIAAKSRQSAFFSRYVWNVNMELDIYGMREAASFLSGQHDFRSFRGSGCGAKTTVRKIISLDIKELKKISFMTVDMKGDFIKIKIEGDAFLRYMVRNIVGTLVEIGKGKIPPEKMKDILAAYDRKLAGPTASAKGLFLEKITY
ncbi:MAG: tRNA pseudouridine(38-40) synthase TruA [Nitrospirae bacterium GWC2_42_7]|nr:MAG: tRNA pseudouridine(38-40) synthase TruA [Nitrospirae bacterium GWC2_42_7]HBO83571.1 tRNA pseudouridine(38-40) synthase TruA [Deltaproteobacteria bacterium]